jgi:hypothetical protein
LPANDATQRVNQIIADAKDVAYQARKSAVIIASPLQLQSCG